MPSIIELAVMNVLTPFSPWLHVRLLTHVTPVPGRTVTTGRRLA